MISRMDRIYSNAHLTIIAAAGENAHTGLPGVSTFHRRRQEEVRIQGTTLLRIPSHGVEALDSSTWGSRAWTYQECYFSRRRLIFAADQVLFLCNGLYAAESVKQPLSPGAFRGSNTSFSHFISKVNPPKPDGAGFNLIYQIEEYCRRNLSNDSDSLNALLGVLNYNTSTLRKTTYPSVHLWGVPIRMGFAEFGDAINMYLSWYHTTISKRRADFPSWAWAGWAGRLGFYNSWTPVCADRRGAQNQGGEEGLGALQDVYISLEDDKHLITTLRNYIDDALVNIGHRH